jgi:hypothetical protein
MQECRLKGSVRAIIRCTLVDSDGIEELYPCLGRHLQRLNDKDEGVGPKVNDPLDSGLTRDQVTSCHRVQSE